MTAAKRTKKPKPAISRPLPPALAERAEAMVAMAKTRVLREARAALEEARAAMAETERHYYELGRALLTLRKEGYAEALGFKGGLRELCERELELSWATVDRLLRAVEALTQEQFARLKRTRVDALLALAAATEADDTEAILAGETVTLWEKGPLLDVGAAKTPALLAAATEVRAQRTATKSAPGRGRSASPEERAQVKLASRDLRAAGSKAATKVRATKPGAPSVFDLTGLTAAEFARAVKALTAKKK